MLLFRSPILTFALLFFILSITLSICIFNVHQDESKNLLQFLILCPPLNCIFLFLLSLTSVERRFRLSYIPLICLLILISSSILLTSISARFLSLSLIIYVSLIYYSISSILFLAILIVIIICYAYGSLCIHRYRNMMTIEQQTTENVAEIEPIHLDQLILKAPNTEQLILSMSILPGRRIRHDIRNIQDDLTHIHVDTIITLNESKELSFMNMTNKNLFDMDVYSTHIKRANIEHIHYPIRDRFIPKSISDYIQFLYSVILNAQRTNRQRILVHCMGGMGRTGMTIVCLELLYEHLMENNPGNERKQNFLERICHYPFVFQRTCRVCQAIDNLRQIRPGTIHNPLQILFVHEVYARFKSNSYMQEIKHCFNLREDPLLNTTSHNYFS